jgi:phage recombination protein Bet
MSTPALGDEQQMTATTTATDVADKPAPELGVEFNPMDPKNVDAELADALKDVGGLVAEPLTGDSPSSAEVMRFEMPEGKGVLSIDPHQEKWTEVQRVALKSIGIEVDGPNAVPMAYVGQFLHICQVRQLDPWLRESYLIVHGRPPVWKDGRIVKDERKFTIVTGIDGFRRLGDLTGKYAGQVGPEWCGEDEVWKTMWSPKWGVPVAARVGILRTGFALPVWGLAMYDEFVPLVDEYAGEYPNKKKTGNKVPTPMWQKMPKNQIAKCAEAQGWRKAFPRTFSGMYAPEEMERAEAEYQEAAVDQQARYAAAERQQAFLAAQAAASGDEVVVGEIVDEAAGGASVERPRDPVSIGDSARETVEQMRAGTRAPRKETRAPGNAPASETRASEGDRLTWLRAEITMLAGLLGVTEAKLLARQVAAHGKDISEFTSDELLTAVLPLRARGASALREDGRGAEAAAYETAPRGAVMPLDLLLGRGAASQPHQYVDAGGACGVTDCGAFADEPIHLG